MSLSSHRQQQLSRVEVWNAIRPDPNYIPGLGRGAQGFTTRSDIGPSKFTPTPAQQAQVGIPSHFLIEIPPFPLCVPTFVSCSISHYSACFSLNFLDMHNNTRYDDMKCKVLS
jgi:hypothetical protein